LSPSTERYDRTIKFDKYWTAGVREYWLINIEKKKYGYISWIKARSLTNTVSKIRYLSASLKAIS